MNNPEIDRLKKAKAEIVDKFLALLEEHIANIASRDHDTSEDGYNSWASTQNTKEELREFLKQIF